MLPKNHIYFLIPQAVAINTHVLNFLGENGLSDKVRTILNAAHKKQDSKNMEGNILDPEEAVTVFPPMPPEMYQSDNHKI